jgi:hypothetical protein
MANNMDINESTLRPSVEQDRAAGGSENRKIFTESGDIATISLAVSDSLKGSSIALRFKHGGKTVRRKVGLVVAATRFEALQLGWAMVRAERIVESQGWRWVVADGPQAELSQPRAELG